MRQILFHHFCFKSKIKICLRLAFYFLLTKFSMKCSYYSRKIFHSRLKIKKTKQFLFIHISTKLSFARFNLFSRFSLFNTVFLSETNFNSIRTFFKQFYRLPLDVLERHFDATKKE